MATGNEILNYQGNAELGAGTAGGIGGFNNTASDLNGGVQKLLGDVMQQQFAWNGKLYAQAIKDRDDTYALMASQDIDMPVLDEDRTVLQNKIDEIKNDMISTPNLKADRKRYIEVQGKINDLTAMKAGAKTRYATAAKMQQAAASELNPELKGKMERHLSDQLSKGVMHQIDPYSQTVTYDKKDLTDVRMVTSYLQSVGADGVPRRTSLTMPDYKAYTEEVNLLGRTTGEQLDMAYKIKSFFDQQTQNDMLMTPESIKEINAKINQFNLDNKLDKNSEFFAKPFAEIDEATNSVSVKTSPADFFKSFKVANTWKKTQGAAEVDKDALEGQKKVMDIRTGYQDATTKRISANASMVKAKADASLVPAQIEELKARAKKLSKEGDNVESENNLLKAQGMQDLIDGFQLHGNEALLEKGYDKIKGSPYEKALPVWYNTSLPGIDGEWEIRNLGKSDRTAIRALSNKVTDYPKNDKGEIIKGTSPVTKEYTPSYVFMLRSPDHDPNKQKLVGVDKAGNIIKVLDVNQTAEELLRNSSGYNLDASYSKQLAGLNIARQQLQGSDVAGLDLRAALNMGDVVDNTSGGRNIGTVDLAGEQMRVEGDRLIDPKTRKVVAVKVNGKWVNP